LTPPVTQLKQADTHRLIPSWGQTGLASVTENPEAIRTRPTAVGVNPGFATLSGGAHHICGLTRDGRVFCWGLNSFGQLGDGSRASRADPVAVSGGIAFASVSPGTYQTCALTQAGQAYCWGRDLANPRLDLADVITAPTPVPGGMTFKAGGN
jgi:alpha-tubulin suppressor-like RCC1 family protein